MCVLRFEPLLSPHDSAMACEGEGKAVSLMTGRGDTPQCAVSQGPGPPPLRNNVCGGESQAAATPSLSLFNAESLLVGDKVMHVRRRGEVRAM